MSRYQKTWFVIADGARARILRNDGPGTALVPAINRDLIDPAVHGHSRDLKSDKPGRAFDTGSGQHHSMEPHHDFHNFEKRMFARKVAKLLDEQAGKKAIERLVLVAPPKTLGDLRAELSSHTSALVAAEIAKDLTHLPVKEIADHLRDVPQF